MIPRIENLVIRNLRSIGTDPVSLNFPQQGALVLLGENNSGKSNITRGLDILFGDSWPGYRQLEEHDFYGRDSDGIAVSINSAVSGLACSYCSENIKSFSWTHDQQNENQDGNPVSYRFACSSKFCGKSWPKREMRELLGMSMVDADRRLNYQLSYASKYTMLSKLMRKFHQRLLSTPGKKEALQNSFVSLVEEFKGIPEFEKFQAFLAEAADGFGQNLPYRLDIDFSAYDPSNFFHSLRVHPTFSGEVRSFDELGTGQSQILALAFVYAYSQAYGNSESNILVIDEPEANLHPLAQQWLAKKLNSLVVPGLQVLITTHSPYFVDMAQPESLVIVRKCNEVATGITQHTLDGLREELVKRGVNANRIDSGTIGSFYAASATAEIVSGLFARKCVLVEGPTEALALPELLLLRGFDVLKEGVAVVPVSGVGNIAKWHRLYSSYGIPCFCVFDTDSNKTGRESNDLHDKRRDIMSAIGHDQQLANTDTQELTPLSVHDGYAMFEPNFEDAARQIFNEWSALEAIATRLVGDSKPLKARYAAQNISSASIEQDAIQLLDSLIDAISTQEPVQVPHGSFDDKPSF